MTALATDRPFLASRPLPFDCTTYFPLTLVMSPQPAHVRLGTEAGRAFIGLWFVAVSLAGAQPLYRWLDSHQPAHPELGLLSGLGLASLCCTGIGLSVMAGFRGLMHAIAPRASEKGSVRA